MPREKIVRIRYQKPYTEIVKNYLDETINEIIGWQTAEISANESMVEELTYGILINVEATSSKKIIPWGHVIEINIYS